MSSPSPEVLESDVYEWATAVNEAVSTARTSGTSTVVEWEGRRHAVTPTGAMALIRDAEVVTASVRELGDGVGSVSVDIRDWTDVQRKGVVGVLIGAMSVPSERDAILFGLGESVVQLPEGSREQQFSSLHALLRSASLVVVGLSKEWRGKLKRVLDGKGSSNPASRRMKGIGEPIVPVAPLEPKVEKSSQLSPDALYILDVWPRGPLPESKAKSNSNSMEVIDGEVYLDLREANERVRKDVAGVLLKLYRSVEGMEFADEESGAISIPADGREAFSFLVDLLSRIRIVLCFPSGISEKAQVGLSDALGRDARRETYQYYNRRPATHRKV